MAICVEVARQIRRLGARIDHGRGQLASTKALPACYLVKNLSGHLGIDFETVREDATGLPEEGLGFGKGSFHEDSFSRQRF